MALGAGLSIPGSVATAELGASQPGRLRRIPRLRRADPRRPVERSSVQRHQSLRVRTDG